MDFELEDNRGEDFFYLPFQTNDSIWKGKKMYKSRKLTQNSSSQAWFLTALIFSKRAGGYQPGVIYFYFVFNNFSVQI